MGRKKKEEYWNQVTRLGGNGWRCNHCGGEFKSGASRIKAHLEGIQGRGIEVCKQSMNPHQQQHVIATNPVQAEDGHESSMDHQTNAGSQLFGFLEVSEDGHDMVDASFGASIDHQINPESIDLVGGSAPQQRVNQHYNLGSDISQLNELTNDLSSVEREINQQLQWLESRGKKRKRSVDDWLNEVQHLRNEVHKMNETAHQYDMDTYHVLQFLVDNFRKQKSDLTEKVRKHKEQKPVVLSNEFVGQSFEKHVKKMWELVGDEKVFIMGIHGMGGVGKTWLATYMEKEIKRNGTFKHVFWVTVSRDFSILKLQNDMAERIGVKLYGDDERTRAENLWLALEEKEKSLIIMDDVWKHIDLQQVGIPIGVNGIKLILTSRLEHVCYQMNCPPNNIIRMHPLYYDEAWELFSLKLGLQQVFPEIPPRVLQIARSVVWKCCGLPLGLCVMARTMKGVNSIHRWRHTLNKLENSVMGEEMENEVFKVLKLSYDNLTEKGMKNWFLRCALYRFIRAEDLSIKLFEDGIINGTRSRSLGEIFDEGCSIYEELKGHSVLFQNKMHGLMRNMACHILKERQRWMVKCDEGLTEVPHMQEWTTDLELVSLDDYKIEEIPEAMSPHCPQLSTLILSLNNIRSIPNCFFTHMNTLAVLDLSWNERLTSLPDSVSNLRSLISLNLRGCWKLEDVPPLEKLEALSRLDISGTSVKQVGGLEMLMNLKWLDLSFNRQLSFIPESVLPGLMNLQYLNLIGAGSIKVKVQDVKGMGKLECFGGTFDDCKEYNNYVDTIHNTGYGPKTYLIMTDFPTELGFDECEYFPLDDDGCCQTVVIGDCKELAHSLPADLAMLKIYINQQWTSLCGNLSCNGHSSLRKIELIYCERLESLFCSFFGCSWCRNVRNLESLNLQDMGSLHVICRQDVANGSNINAVFSHLKHFYISGCSKVETLLMPVIFMQLQNLETLTVASCHSLREIFADDDDGGGSTITLPKLTKLALYHLPALKTVCKGTIISTSKPKLRIDRCPNLERVPTIQVSKPHVAF